MLIASLSLGRFSAASSSCLQSSQDVINAFRSVSLLVVVVSHSVLQIYDLAQSVCMLLWSIYSELAVTY